MIRSVRAPIIGPSNAGIQLIAPNRLSFAQVMQNAAPFYWYRLDDSVPFTGGWTAADSSGNGFNLPATNTFHFWSSVQGLLVGDADTAINRSTSFAGDIINSGGAVGLTGWPTGSHATTFFALVELQAVGSGFKGITFVGPNVAGETLGLGLRDGKPAFSISTHIELDASTVLSTNTVYVLVGDFDGSTVRLFINNVLVASASSAGPNIPSNPPVWLFNDSNWLAGGTNLAGTLDEVAGWPILLDDATRTALYQAAIGF